MVRILVVDDDKQINRLVSSYLEQANFQVLSAYDGNSAFRLIRSERPELIILDLMLPDSDGWQITRMVRADPQLAATPILMLTARVSDSDKIQGLELGADDYVTKPFNPHEIVARVRAILRRGQSPPVVHKRVAGSLVLDLDQHTAQLAGDDLELTPTEFALLQLLLEYPNRAFTRQELIETGLGYQYEGLERTIDSHIKNLRKKLEGANAPQIETVYGVGYRLKE